MSCVGSTPCPLGHGHMLGSNFEVRGKVDDLGFQVQLSKNSLKILGKFYFQSLLFSRVILLQRQVAKGLFLGEIGNYSDIYFWKLACERF